MSEDRRISDVRLALIEQKLDLTLESIDRQFKTLTDEVRKYNGVREKLEHACSEIEEHKEGHWKSYGIFFGIVTLVLGIFKILRMG